MSVTESDCWFTATTVPVRLTRRAAGCAEWSAVPTVTAQSVAARMRLIMGNIVGPIAGAGAGSRSGPAVTGFYAV